MSDADPAAAPAGASAVVPPVLPAGAPKHVPDPGFSGDDGTADARLTGALAAWADGRGTHAEVMAALLQARVVVPVVAVAAAVDQAAARPDLTVERSTDMALVTLLDDRGRRALPVFTGTASLAAWRPDARPVPAESVRAALSAAAEGAQALVVDVAGPVRYDVAGERLEALARARAWVPVAEDPAVLGAVAGAVGGEGALDGGSVVAGPGGTPRVVLHPVPGTTAEALAAAARRVAAALAAEEAVRARAAAGLEIVVAPRG